MKQKIGALFEQLFSTLYGTEKIPGSGSGIWRKLDAENSHFLFSLKATANDSFSVTKADLDEVNQEARGPGGVSEDVIPALAVCFVENEVPSKSDKILAVLPMNDLVALLKERPEAFPSNKHEKKYATASVPGLFRKTEES